MPLPDAVAGLIARGLAVFPIPDGQKIAPPGWHSRASRDPGQAWPAAANIGVGCRASNLVVVDLDRKHSRDGIDAFGSLCAAAAVPWPDTFTVATPNGLHLYFTAPEGRTVASAIGHPLPGIDIRAPGAFLGGYVIGPGSAVNGRPYRIHHPHPVTPLPAWLAALLRPARPSRHSNHPEDGIPRLRPVVKGHTLCGLAKTRSSMTSAALTSTGSATSSPQC
jgi:hypothetical protein